MGDARNGGPVGDSRAIVSSRLTLLLTAAALSTAAAAGAATPPSSDDGLLPVDQYTSPRARSLGERHRATLQTLSFHLYHCLPWLEVYRHGIGFFRPTDRRDQERYLSLRVYVEQAPSDAFTGLTPVERATAMFSRYVGPLLRRLAGDEAVKGDGDIDGFAVVVEWLKPGPRELRPVHEGLVAYLERELALEYLDGRAGAAELASRGRVVGFDGQRTTGALALAAWDDGFVDRHRVEGYRPDPSARCP